MQLTTTQIEHLLQRLAAEADALSLPAPRRLFTAADVVRVHTHKAGVGDGIWLRLVDGSVVNRFGEPQDPDPLLYDTVATSAGTSA